MQHLSPIYLSLILFLGPALSGSTAYDPLRATGEYRFFDTTFTTDSGREIPLRVFHPSVFEDSPTPVILFSHGLGGSREGSNYLGRHWSGRGYVTVFVQHPGSDSSVYQGKPPQEIRRALQAAANTENYLLRIRDIHDTIEALENFHRDPANSLHGHLDLSRIGMSGHSFGAKTTQAVSGEQSGFARSDSNSARHPAIRAALPMSPSPAKARSPETSFGAVDLPWLLMTGTQDGVPAGLSDTTPDDRRLVYAALPPGDKYELVLDQAEHHAFTEHHARGRSRNPAHHPAILAISTAFWDAYLGGDKDAGKWLKQETLPVLAPQDIWQFK